MSWGDKFRFEAERLNRSANELTVSAQQLETEAEQLLRAADQIESDPNFVEEQVRGRGRALADRANEEFADGFMAVPAPYQLPRRHARPQSEPAARDRSGQIRLRQVPFGEQRKQEQRDACRSVGSIGCIITCHSSRSPISPMKLLRFVILCSAIAVGCTAHTLMANETPGVLTKRSEYAFDYAKDNPFQYGVNAGLFRENTSYPLSAEAQFSMILKVEVELFDNPSNLEAVAQAWRAWAYQNIKDPRASAALDRAYRVRSLAQAANQQKAGAVNNAINNYGQ